MRQRNAAARFSKKALGTPRRLKLDSTATGKQIARQAALEKAVADGRNPRCPRCDRPMVAQPKWRFYGCSGYPNDCREKLEFDEWAAMLGNEVAAKQLAKQRSMAARRRQDKT